ncbi:hypothetical protein Tcur_0923 [Thermomonospora curvata DSM 43183]|uniref:Uncharacterized protein n=1 Tax=Thermomonospora curvata (strain ATCC 19995 / DSM 43183 / JCM 3096 / KCTC 9072 / NBRC 15933 / NCIMB 10081 / Henssen B9) TaxID=471852 RepID=D1A6N4_THECD|nr:hypothetical protein Tcur_0923 [Thermomonospora curvata DSM 43183]
MANVLQQGRQTSWTAPPRDYGIEPAKVRAEYDALLKRELARQNSSTRK